MFLKDDNVSAERMSTGRLFQATGPSTQNARLPSCPLNEQIATDSSGTRSRKVRDSGNWDAQFVEITMVPGLEMPCTRTVENLRQYT